MERSVSQIEKKHIAGRLRQLAEEIEFGQGDTEIEVLGFSEVKTPDALIVVSDDAEHAHYLAAVDVRLRFVFPNSIPRHD